MNNDRRILSTEARHEKAEMGQWWLFVPVLALLVFLAWGFVYVYCDPVPTTFETIIFFGLLALILFETVSAGFYGGADS